MATPPPRWRVYPGRATCVEMACLWKAHREYSRNRQGWQEKLLRAAGTVAWRLSLGAAAACEVHLAGDDPDCGPLLQCVELIRHAAKLLAQGTNQRVGGVGAIL